MSFKDEIQAKIDNLNKPKGSLGRLEELAMQICLTTALSARGSACRPVR